MKVIAIIVAGGSGNRFGSNIPKQYHKINNNTILEKSINIFIDNGNIDNILVVIREEDQQLYNQLLLQHKKILPYVIGGKERYNSVYNALDAISDKDYDICLIHDAVRPFLSHELINNLILTTKQYGNAIPVIDISDSICNISNNEFHYVNRDDYKIIQTPQSFMYREIYEAYKFADINTKDESSLYCKLNKRVYFITGDITNKKVTYSSDIVN